MWRKGGKSENHIQTNNQKYEKQTQFKNLHTSRLRKRCRFLLPSFQKKYEIFQNIPKLPKYLLSKSLSFSSIQHFCSCSHPKACTFCRFLLPFFTFFHPPKAAFTPSFMLVLYYFSPFFLLLFHLFYPPKAAFLYFSSLTDISTLNSIYNKDLHKILPA